MNKIVENIQRQQCRVCLEDVKFYKYFSETLDSVQVNAEDSMNTIFSAFVYCTNLQFDENESSEVNNQFICNSCLNSLKFAHEFIRKAREADTQFRDYALYEILPKDCGVVEQSSEDDGDHHHNHHVDDTIEHDLDSDSLISETPVVEDDVPPSAVPIREEYVYLENQKEAETFCEEELQNIEVEAEEYILEEIDDFEQEAEVFCDEDMSSSMEILPKDQIMEVEVESTVDDSNIENLIMEDTQIMKKPLSKKDLPANYLCVECPKAFVYNFQLQHHIKVTHTDEDIAKSYLCNQCDKKFYTKRHLVKHVNTVHREGRDFKCDMCGKEFQYKERLTRHIKTHVDRRHQCQQCGKSYVQNADLLIHMRTHTNEKPFQCEQCPEAFRNRSRLTNHVKRVHLDVTYSCRYCSNYKVKSQSTLRRHEQEHLKFTYQCPKCEREFSRRKYFKDHMSHAHNYIMPEHEINEMFIKNKNDIKRMEAEIFNLKNAELISYEVAEDADVVS